MIFQDVELTAEWTDLTALMTIPVNRMVFIQNKASSLMGMWMSLIPPTEEQTGRLFKSLDSVEVRTSVANPNIYLKGRGTVNVIVSDAANFGEVGAIGNTFIIGNSALG